jgi:hypothetical protein
MVQSGENCAQNSAQYTENSSSEQSNGTEHGADSTRTYLGMEERISLGITS